MDKNVTFRFFAVRRHAPGMAFSEALRQVSNIARLSDRERQLAEDFDVRLEQLETEPGGVLTGEVTRIQRTNLPSEIQGNGRISLTTNNPLGHGIVFRFHPRQSVLGIQYDVRIASPGRFVEYLRMMIDDAAYELQPRVRNDMWDRFNNGPTRKVIIGIARPESLQQVQRGPARALVSSFENMADAYEAPNIKIELSMGGKSGGLAESVKGMAAWFRDRLIRGEVELNSFKAVAEVEDGPNDEIDLLSDILSIKEKLQLHDRDPDINYRIRRDALRVQMNAWIR